MSIFHRSLWLLLILPVLALAFAFSTAAALSTGGAVSGIVYFDANGNALREAGENGVGSDGDYRVTINIRDQASNGAVFQSSYDTLDGTYTFTGVPDGIYIVTTSNGRGFVSTTLNPWVVIVAGGAVSRIDFGVALPITLVGTLYNDVDGDGRLSLRDTPMVDVAVELFADTFPTNGRIDFGEIKLGKTVSDSQGNYMLPDLLPGPRVLRIRPPGIPTNSITIPLVLISEWGRIVREDRALNVTPANASESGVVWNDANGNEQIDAGEAGLPNVALALVRDDNVNGQVDADEGVKWQGVTTATGAYSFTSVPGSEYYVLQVDDATVPAGWMASQDPSLLASGLAAGEAKTLNVGYFDALNVAPMRVADWKKEVKRAGLPRYTTAEVSQFVANAEAVSAVFAEVESLNTALLGLAPNAEHRAHKEHAALRLNIASNRLLAKTPVRLSSLTAATTVGAAVTEIEGILAPPGVKPDSEYVRAESIARALNSGEGVGNGLVSLSSVTRATYNGYDVTSSLRPDSYVVDASLRNGPIYLTKWSPGSLSGTTNIFNPKLRLKVEAFYNGAVLEVKQKLADGSLVSVGVITPTVWNKDVKATYTLDIWRVSTLVDLTKTEFRLYVIDPDNDIGPEERIKVDAAEVIFSS